MSSSAEVKIDKAVPRIRALYAEKRFKEIIDVIRTALADSQSRGNAWQQIANAANTVSDRFGAIQAAARWRREVPNEAEPYIYLANQLLSVGRLEDAERQIDYACENFPQDAHAWYAYGNIAEASGDAERAIEHYRKAWSLNPQFFAAWDRIAAIKSFTPNDPDIALIKDMPTAAAALGDGFAAVAHAACAKMYDKLGEPKRAFYHFERAAKLTRFSEPYSMDRQLGMMKNALDSFDKALLERFEGGGDPTEQPIFIAAPPEGGGRFIEHVLAQHSAVRAGGQSGVMRAASWELYDFAPAAVTAFADADNADEKWLEIGSSHVVLSEELYGPQQHITSYDYGLNAQIGLIALALPNAKIIFCERNIHDLGWACFRRQHGGAQPWTTKFEDIGRYLAAYRHLRNAWEERLPGRTLTVSYEELLAKPATQGSRILEFCGLEPQSACMQRDAWTRGVEMETAVNEWRGYAPHLGDWFKTAERYALS